MRRRISKAGSLLLLAALAAAFVVGCGSSGSDGGVTVQTGSLSKAAFVKKADAICEEARANLLAKYYAFLKTHKALANRQDAHSREVVATETVNSVLAPNIESEIKQVSELGAPEDYAPEVASFLDTLDEQLEKAQGNPNALSSTAAPFERAAVAAKRAGLLGCAESFG